MKLASKDLNLSLGRRDSAGHHDQSRLTKLNALPNASLAEPLKPAKPAKMAKPSKIASLAKIPSLARWPSLLHHLLRQGSISKTNFCI